MAKEYVMPNKPGVKFSVAAIDNAKEILKALPAAPRETKEVGLREAIEQLAPTIRGLIGKGYSRQQIVDLLQEQGVGCTLATLKTYFRRSPGKARAKGGQAIPSSSRATHRSEPPTAARAVLSRAAGEPSAAGSGAATAVTQEDSQPSSRSSGANATVGVPVSGTAGRGAAKAS